MLSTSHGRRWAAPLTITACATLLCAFAAGARGRVDELLHETGISMLSYGQGADLDEARSIALNGAQLRVLSGRSSDTVGALLDVFEARCANAGGEFAQQLIGAQPGLLQRAGRVRPALLDGVLRSDDGERGYVVCFDLGGTRMQAAEVVARLRAFAASGDLSAIGELRFVWAQRADRKTSYVASWSEGRLPLRAMFPAEGDAPGVDVPGVPRPAHARRVLSAWQTERAPLLVSYASDMPPAQFESAYRAQLQAHGFEIHASSADGEGAHDWLLRRGSWSGIAVVAPGERSGSSLALCALR